MARDLYEILGVSKTASEDDIKKAFRKLAAKHHPDRNPGKANEDRFKEVNAANEVLSDAKRRALYDEFGEMSLQQGFDPERARAMRDFKHIVNIKPHHVEALRELRLYEMRKRSDPNMRKPSDPKMPRTSSRPAAPR